MARSCSRSEGARRGPAWVLGCALLLASLVACGAPRVIWGEVVVPASIPIRTHPRVLVGSAPAGDDAALAFELRRALARDDLLQVEQFDLDQLSTLRAGLPPTTALLALELDLEADRRERYVRRPETVCDSGGCWVRERPSYYTVPWVRGRLRVRFFRGGELAPWQEVELRAQAEARPLDALEESVRGELLAALLGLVEAHVDEERVTLLRVRGALSETVEQARALAAAGHWERARATLEAVPPDILAGLPAEDQARLLYDLGTLRRFAPVELAQADDQLAAAEDALQAALALVDSARYREAVTRVRSQRELLRRRLAQAREAEANFRRSGRHPGAPPPPRAYREPAPSAGAASIPEARSAPGERDDALDVGRPQGQHQ